MRFCGHSVILALLLHFLNGELILVRKQDEVYCMESNSSNKALTWIPTIERDKKFIYKEEVLRMPTNESLEEFRHLNCDLMRDGGCPLTDKHTESWEIIEHASDDYGFISDRRWHVLPMYNTSGNPHERQEIPVTISDKGQIHMSILAKNSAIITLTDGQKGHIIIKLDAYVKQGGRRTLEYCRSIKQCREIASTPGSTLKDGERWKNVKIVIEKKRDTLLITINNNDVLWNIPNTFSYNDYGIFQVKNLSITTTNRQMGFWKFHDYKVLRLKERGKELTLDFETRNNPQLCLSILYHSGGLNEQVPNAATLMIASNTEAIADRLQAGKDWQEYRRVFNLKINTKYQLSLMPMEYFSTFAIGEIRVCHEREYSVTKMKINREENVKCSVLNEDNKVIVSKLEDADNLFSYGCPHGNFGENCNIQCSEFGSDNCKGLRVCSTKLCSCLPGYNGTNCETECQGSYGPRCRMSCNHCRNGKQCDFVTGSCPNAECEDGYMPGQDALCEHKCRDGTFGRNCEQNCSAFCPIPHRCSHTAGSCTGGGQCAVKFYEAPTCQYLRFLSSELPQLTKSGVNSFKFSIRAFSGEIQLLIHQIGI